MMTDRNKKLAGRRLLRGKHCEGTRKTSESFYISPTTCMIEIRNKVYGL